MAVIPVSTGSAEQRRRERWSLGVAVASVAFVVSYALQRLLAIASGEPDWTTIIRQAHTPFYWRCGLALVHAAIALPLAAWLPPEAFVRPLLRFAPLWVIGTVSFLALAMVAFP